jgi:hypothetical protein
MSQTSRASLVTVIAIVLGLAIAAISQRWKFDEVLGTEQYEKDVLAAAFHNC